MEAIGRWLVGAGAVLLLTGLVLWGAAHLGLPLGRLPGDLRIERPGLRLYVPLGSCLLLSALLSLVLWLLGRLR